MAATGTRVETLSTGLTAGTYTTNLINDGRFTWSLIVLAAGTVGTSITGNVFVSPVPTTTGGGPYATAGAPTQSSATAINIRATYSAGGLSTSSGANPSFPPITEPYIQVTIVVVGTYTSVSAFLIGASVS